MRSARLGSGLLLYSARLCWWPTAVVKFAHISVDTRPYMRACLCLRSVRMLLTNCPGRACRVDVACSPSLDCVLRWTQSLVDRHSSKLLIDKAIQGHLKIIAQRLAASAASVEKLGACAGMAKQSINMPGPVARNSHEQFSLEVLDLRVDKNV